MLPVETLNQITATHAAATGKPLNTFVPAALVPDQYSVQTLEHLEMERSRFRGRLSTQSFRDFCTYVEQHQGESDKPAGFVDADAMACQVLFNLGDIAAPGHGDDSATLTLKPTAAFNALRQIAGKTLKQSQLAEWMEDWHDFLEVRDTTGTIMATAVAVQKVRSITIKAMAERTSTEQNFGASRSSMDSIEAAHAEQQPSDLMFTTPPYDGLGSCTFTLRLSIITGDTPLLKVRWVMQEQQEEEMAQEFKDRLTSEIGGLCTLTVGTFAIGK
ncbi:MAG TPA: hypothetical protein DEP32_11710 [Pseudomonas sp.]|nr:hypothetical protein [Pseudomonas sp.]MBB51224.1 hypothetical protein [Pseudomonadales bacterium]MBB52258.1 hypothetical protein [Pseudomonadales bacterium]HCA24819.1 hypothetical protein [Pseudomonas sp.]|tara:strand:+ start:8573 stop:9391 length:819 start_codon:yes stop_codon:yes gene_type:complete